MSSRATLRCWINLRKHFRRNKSSSEIYNWILLVERAIFSIHKWVNFESLPFIQLESLPFIQEELNYFHPSTHRSWKLSSSQYTHFIFTTQSQTWKGVEKSFASAHSTVRIFGKFWVACICKRGFGPPFEEPQLSFHRRSLDSLMMKMNCWKFPERIIQLEIFSLVTPIIVRCNTLISRNLE